MNETGNESIRIVVVADSAMARAGLEAAAIESGRFEIAGSTDSAGVAQLLESTGAEAVLMEARTFSGWQAESVQPVDRAPTPLTPRETEVLRMVSNGESNKAIAWKLGISEHTAKFHVASILSKLNAGSRTEAVTLGVRLGLIYL